MKKQTSAKLKHRSSRAIAAKILTPILQQKKSLREAAAELKQDSFSQELCYGVLRYYFQLEFVLTQLTEQAVKDTEIKALLLIGLYQLFFLEKAAYAAVTETVNAAKQLQKSWATGFINGVLRTAIRSQDQLQQKINDDLAAYYAHPLWIIEKLQIDFPNDWQHILQQNNQHPPLTLRLNTAKLTRAQYLAKLKTETIAATPTAISPYGIKIEKPTPLTNIYGFSQGLISVQDEAAQLAAMLLNLSAGQTVLDACAAPGGKTTHILEIAPQLKQLVAVDVQQQRLQLIQANLDRLNLTAELVNEDIKTFGARWENNYFDRILLDVPCSSSGVIRRHPDIKLLRRVTDIAQLAQQQYEILTAVWPLLKPGGLLLYVTCSIFPEENSAVLAKFLQHTADAQEELIATSWGRAMPIGRQILPGDHNMDGFYFAKLIKSLP